MCSIEDSHSQARKLGNCAPHGLSLTLVLLFFVNRQAFSKAIENTRCLYARHSFVPLTLGIRKRGCCLRYLETTRALLTGQQPTRNTFRSRRQGTGFCRAYMYSTQRTCQSWSWPLDTCDTHKSCCHCQKPAQTLIYCLPT